MKNNTGKLLAAAFIFCLILAFAMPAQAQRSAYAGGQAGYAGGGTVMNAVNGPDNTMIVRYTSNGVVTQEVITAPDGTVTVKYWSDGTVARQVTLGPGGSTVGSVGGAGGTIGGTIGSPGGTVVGSVGSGGTSGYISG